MAETTALTIGTFDPPHIGHVQLIRRCEQLADRVVIGVNVDAWAGSYKRPPMFSFDERAQLMGLLGHEVAANTSPGRELVERVMPDLLVIGMDWLSKDYLGQIDMTADWLQINGVSLVYVPYTTGISTSEIISRAG